MSETSQPQVAQLISFLQEPFPSNGSERGHSSRGSMTMSTFKPEQSLGSTVSLQDVAVKNFNLNYDLATFRGSPSPQLKFEYDLVTVHDLPASEFAPTRWKNSKDYLNNPYFFDDDDFCQLGFRPQDEITTEL